MDIAATITAVSGALAAIGLGVWRLIERADKKRERLEGRVEQLMSDSCGNLEKEKTQLAGDLARERQAHHRTKKTAGHWRDQLLHNDIRPEPYEWPDAEEPE